MLRMIRSSVVAVVAFAAIPAFAQPKVAATDDLSLLPADSELVAGLDFQSTQGSTLWKQLVAPMLAKGDAKEQLTKFQKTCGVDPMKVVTTISLGLKGIGNEHPDGVIVAHGVPKAKLIACFDKMTKQKKQPDTITRDGDVLLVKNDDNSMVGFAFVDDSTAIIVVGNTVTGDGVRAVTKGTSALKTSPKFVEFYNKTNTKDTVWMIMRGSSKAFDELRKSGIDPQVLYGSVKVTKDLNLSAKIRFKTADEAKKVAGMVQGEMKNAASMFDKIAVDAEGSDVAVSILLTDKKLVALLKQMKK